MVKNNLNMAIRFEYFVKIHINLGSEFILQQKLKESRCVFKRIVYFEAEIPQ